MSESCWSHTVPPFAAPRAETSRVFNVADSPERVSQKLNKQSERVGKRTKSVNGGGVAQEWSSRKASQISTRDDFRFRKTFLAPTVIPPRPWPQAPHCRNPNTVLFNAGLISNYSSSSSSRKHTSRVPKKQPRPKRTANLKDIHERLNPFDFDPTQSKA